ncbi:hypothetical protein HY798_00880 [Candidatus Falkowbacteria bacterium]|nr:hypothetical protein [Candidatus Falkowbacteria bacterium]
MTRIEINQSGQTAIILAILVLTVILTIGLGISALVLNQFKTMRAVGFSVEALYAADAGAEKCLYDVRGGTGLGCDGAGGAVTGSLNNGSTYSAEKTVDTGQSPAVNYIRSLGQYQTTSRKVELSWEE